MRTLLFSVLALSFGAAACIDVEDDAEIAELEEGTDDDKSDRPDLVFTEVDFQAPIAVDELKVGVIKSATQWKAVFGVSAPSSIQFDREWVAYYTAGVQTTGGYSAQITRLRISDTGKTLKIDTRLNKPGNDCVVTLALTAPYTIVKFEKPASPLPTRNGYYKTTEVYSCKLGCQGTSVSEPAFVSTGNGNEECEIQEEHCLTNDSSACPQPSPLPPTYCPDGTVQTVPNYIASADGMECSFPSVHCVTNDQSACPLFTPLPPSWCASGRVVTEPDYIASADGMECYVPRVHCVIDDAQVCTF
jgi:hypothetical protein